MRKVDNKDQSILAYLAIQSPPHSPLAAALIIVRQLLACLALTCTLAACGGKQYRTPPSATTVDAALTEAMALENVPSSWSNSLHFIMNKESGGRVGIQNPIDSARGLFQLNAANYSMNPNGAASFGNRVEEAQGGIRYIKHRYGTAEKAAAHLLQSGWY